MVGRTVNKPTAFSAIRKAATTGVTRQGTEPLWSSVNAVTTVTWLDRSSRGRGGGEDIDTYGKARREVKARNRSKSAGDWRTAIG